MKSVKFLTVVLTSFLCLAFSASMNAQKTTPKKEKPAKVSPKKSNDCVDALATQIAILEKVCDEMRFVSNQDAKTEETMRREQRKEKIKKIIKGDTVEVCRLFEKVKKSKKICGNEKEIVNQFTALYQE
jgi:uncharacterized protein YfeS